MSLVHTPARTRSCFELHAIFLHGKVPRVHVEASHAGSVPGPAPVACLKGETMKWRASLLGLITILTLGMLVVHPAFAQITTGTVAGTVKDEQGLSVPGASVVLVSESRGAKMGPFVTGETGDFVVPNVTPDTYSVEVTLEGFRPIRRTGVLVSGGDRIAVGSLALQVGSAAETVTVTAEAPLVQSQSGERSFTISTEAVQAIAVNGRTFNNLVNLAPGVVAGTVNGLRTNQNTLQIDGITSVDTGNNGNGVTLTVDAVQEVKVLTTSYQAQYGRSAGAQISAVTKSGTQNFRGTIYADRRRDDLNANTWLNNQRGLPKQKINQSDQGYTIGGPIGRPGGRSKFFFFLNQEFQQVLNANNETRVRVPTELERRGDFSQTLDNAGRPFNLIRDSQSGLPCTATDTRGCFADGGVLGRIPQNRLYNVGLGILNMYPQPNSPGTNNQGYNYVSQESSDQPRRQDLLRVDFEASNAWRFNGKWLHTGGTNTTPYGGGTTGFATNLPQFGSTNPCPCSSQYTVGVSGMLSNSLVTEIFYGSSNRPITNYALNPDLLSRSKLGLSNFPLLFPDAVQRDYVPAFTYSGGGSRVANAPTNGTQYAPFENNNTSIDIVASLTKLWGSHTGKTGFFMNRAVKEQSSRAAANGLVSFVNDASNPFDTGFPFANAAVGVYQSYSQAADWIKGNFLYHNFEWYAQDNWKVNSRLTLDYGIRFYWLQPTYDTKLQASNFLPDQYNAARAPRLYYPGRDAAGNRVGIDQATGAIVPAFNIGRLVPNSGTLVGNGLFGAGEGIDEQLYKNRGIHYAPRFGFAYDVKDDQKFVVRGGFGIFYDRAAGDTVYGMIEQLPTLVQPVLQYGRLQDINSASSTAAPPTIAAFDFDGKLPTVYTYNVGAQMSLPWRAVLDVSFVGSQSRNLNTQVNLNAPAYGTAYLPQNQDPTATPSAVPGATALPVDFLRPYRGFGDIIQIQPTAYADYKSVQTSLNRRFSNGMSFGLNYVLGKAMGTSSTDFPAGNNTYNPLVIGMPRTDSEENQRKANYMPLSTDRRHSFSTNFVWQLPNAGVNNRILAGAIHDWQVSGVFRASSGSPYTVTYNIPGISPFTLTGTTRNESARIVLAGDPGPGYSDDKYEQFNPAAFTTPKTGSLGLESGTNNLKYQPQYVLDMSVSRFIRFGNRRLEFRVDAFNALNTVTITGVNNTLQVRSLADPTPTNLTRDASGALVNPTGFGAVTSVAAARQVQLMARFYF